MTYVLSKQLKEAGFPRGTGVRFPHVHLGNLDCDDEACYVPTLSELIEACGDSFTTLDFSVVTREWDCSARRNAVIDGVEFVHFDRERGSTPEEAVANLWLALNKKQ